MTRQQELALGYVIAAGTVDIRKISETTRQRIIDLAMMDPPLVEIDADRIRATLAGASAFTPALCTPTENTGK